MQSPKREVFVALQCLTCLTDPMGGPCHASAAPASLLASRPPGALDAHSSLWRTALIESAFHISFDLSHLAPARRSWLTLLPHISCVSSLFLSPPPICSAVGSDGAKSAWHLTKHCSSFPRTSVELENAPFVLIPFRSVKSLFTQARAVSGGCVLFFDEIDSLCRNRNDGEDETSRRVKNEFLKQLDGCAPGANGKCNVIVLAATNRPCAKRRVFTIPFAHTHTRGDRLGGIASLPAPRACATPR